MSFEISSLFYAVYELFTDCQGVEAFPWGSSHTTQIDFGAPGIAN